MSFQKALSGQNAVTEPMEDIFAVFRTTVDEDGEEVTQQVITTGDASELVVIYAVPMYVDGKITNVLLGVRSSSEFFDFFDKIEFGETGEAFMINASGDMIAHSNKDLVKG